MTTEQKQAAAALISQGVVNGTSAAKLSPSNKLTRAQFVTMIVRIAAATNADSAPTELAGGTVLTNPSIALTALSQTATGSLPLPRMKFRSIPSAARTASSSRARSALY